MRPSKEMRARARRKKDERALSKELQANAIKWADKCQRIAKHGGRLPPGGICHLTKEKVFLCSVQEWIAVTAQKLGVPPQFIQVKGQGNKPDIDLDTLPSMVVGVPEQWFAMRGIAAKSEAHMMVQKSMADMIKVTMDSFETVVRKRYEILGY